MADTREFGTVSPADFSPKCYLVSVEMGQKNEWTCQSLLDTYIRLVHDELEFTPNLEAVPLPSSSWEPVWDVLD